MIVKSFKSIRPPEPWQRPWTGSPQPQHHGQKQIGASTVPTTMLSEVRPNQSDKDRAKQFKVDPVEFVRRDKIVRQLFIDCKWRVGDTLVPIGENDHEQYVDVIVRHIFKSYHDFTTLEGQDWPKSDKPLIITMQPTKEQEDGTQLLLVGSDWVYRPKLPGAC